MVKFINNTSEFRSLIWEGTENDKLLVVGFTTSWCRPCRTISPHFDKLAKDTPEAVFFKVDLDDAEEIASLEGIEAIPTFKFFRGGEEVAMIRGADLEGVTTKIAELK